jgi:hypothetical protein
MKGDGTALIARPLQRCFFQDQRMVLYIRACMYVTACNPARMIGQRADIIRGFSPEF